MTATRLPRFPVMSSFLARLVLGFGLAASALGASSDRTAFDHSILAVPAAGDPAHPRRGRIVRTALRADEQAAPARFEIALRMRNFDELQARVGRGEQIARSEMAARYFPAAAVSPVSRRWLSKCGRRCGCRP